MHRLLFILGIMALFLGAKVYAEESEIELDAETEEAEADAATRNAEFLRNQEKIERVEFELASAKAQSAIKRAQVAKTISGNEISRADTEIQQLRAAQQIENARRLKAQKERVFILKRLLAIKKLLKNQRHLTQNEQMAALKEKKAVARLRVALTKARKSNQSSLVRR